MHCSWAELNRIAAVLQQHPEKPFTIEGHTDSHGTDEYNLDLSQRRADAVQQALLQLGIAADRMQAVGRGETSRAANRRVEFGMG